MTMQVFERFKAILEVYKLSMSELSERLTIPEQTLYAYRGGKTSPNIYTLEKIINAFPNIDAKWLLTGEGNMYISENAANEDMHIYIASPQNVNKGNIGGSQILNVGECQEKLAAAYLEIGYLKQQVADKELIIELFKQTQK